MTRTSKRTLDRAADLQRELAVLIVRHDETRRRLDALRASMAEQAERIEALRVRIGAPEPESTERPSDVRELAPVATPGTVTAGLLDLLRSS